jgi:O-antigen chain-terminating methyltransferase
MDETRFYRAFEDRHRGSRELIKQRLRQYGSFVQPLADLYPEGLALDLGCGRGEWLEVVPEFGLRARGVDLDAGMLAACTELGLEVGQQDLLDALRACPDASVAVLSAFHVVEHIPFPTLQTLMTEALRVLMPGGLMILETPNPENLVVGSCSFYLDASHIRPLPPLLLEFLAEFAGFVRHQIVRLQEDPALREKTLVSLTDVLHGVSPDYAIVAQKGAAKKNLASFGKAFSQNYGVTLADLARRFDEALEKRLSTLEEEVLALRQALSQASMRTRPEAAKKPAVRAKRSSLVKNKE